jgi:hypothetical protein
VHSHSPGLERTIYPNLLSLKEGAHPSLTRPRCLAFYPSIGTSCPKKPESECGSLRVASLDLAETDLREAKLKLRSSLG